jgi:uncharacterized protein (DUF433 family)
MDVPLRTDENGKIRVGSTRVLLELVIHAFRQGESAEGIVECYSTLKLADVYTVIAYYLTHRAEVDAYIDQQDAQAGQIQKEVESRYTLEDRALFDRLRAIRDQKPATSN